jgi:hypothetical protein
MARTLQHALHSDPSVESGSVPGFDRFIGAWSLEWRGTAIDGSPATSVGELTFGSVLAGSAVQDVWRVPTAVAGDPGIAGTGFHGTTVRFFDPRIDAWRSTWIEPLNGRVRKFIGKAASDRIVLLSTDGEPHLRWSFVDIEPDSFTWIGEFSVDGGHTWTEEERMLATRELD